MVRAYYYRRVEKKGSNTLIPSPHHKRLCHHFATREGGGYEKIYDMMHFIFNTAFHSLKNVKYAANVLCLDLYTCNIANISLN